MMIEPILAMCGGFSELVLFVPVMLGFTFLIFAEVQRRKGALKLALFRYKLTIVCMLLPLVIIYLIVFMVLAKGPRFDQAFISIGIALCFSGPPFYALWRARSLRRQLMKKEQVLKS